jgi:MATE family multidrug resistance protein
MSKPTEKFPGAGHKLGRQTSSDAVSGAASADTLAPAQRARHVSYDDHEMLVLEEGEKGVFDWDVAKATMPTLLHSSVPIMISLFFSISALNLILFMFAGTYTDGPSSSSGQSVVFAGVSLCTMFTNVSFLSVLIGLASAVETLGSQNNGAGNYAETGLALQRCVLILSAVAVPVVFLWLRAGEIFSAIGVAPDVCVVIDTFMRIRLLGMPMDVLNVAYDKYLMSLGVMHPTMYAAGVQNISLLVLLHVFVNMLHMPYSCMAYGWVLAIYIAGIVKFITSYGHHGVQRSFQPPSVDAFKKWGEFLMLGLPGCAMVCAEWWAFELLTIMASGRGTEAIAAQTIVAQTSGVSFMVPLGMSISTTSLVGNAIGSGDIKQARVIGTLSLIIIVVFELFIGIALHFVGRSYDEQFSQDPIVLNLAMDTLPFLSLFVVLDGVQCVAAGICRGAGKQYIGAITSFACYYFVGLPLAHVLCYNLNFDVKGLLMGISAGTFLQCLVFMYLLFVRYDFLFSKTKGVFQKHTIAIRGLSFISDTDPIRCEEELGVDVGNHDSSGSSGSGSGNGEGGKPTEMSPLLGQAPPPV